VVRLWFTDSVRELFAEAFGPLRPECERHFEVSPVGFAPGPGRSASGRRQQGEGGAGLGAEGDVQGAATTMTAADSQVAERERLLADHA
jgi:hypothetical protein